MTNAANATAEIAAILTELKLSIGDNEILNATVTFETGEVCHIITEIHKAWETNDVGAAHYWANFILD